MSFKPPAVGLAQATSNVLGNYCRCDDFLLLAVTTIGLISLISLLTFNPRRINSQM